MSELLSTEQKRLILEKQLTQFATEKYQHELNKKVSKDNEVIIKSSDDALVVLNNLIAVYSEELATLPVVEEPAVEVN